MTFVRHIDMVSCMNVSDLPKARKLSHKGARQKGKRGEYYIKDELNKIGIDAKRVPMSGALAWMKGDVREFNTNPSHVHEVKNCEALELPDWWRQASVQTRSTDPEIPVLHFSGNYRKVHTVMRAADFDELVFAYEQKRPELTLNLITLPSRKNFWKWQAATATGKRDIYLWELSGRTIKNIVYPDEQLIVFPFDLYLTLRRNEVRAAVPA